MEKNELAFRLIDTDDDGYIDRDEFEKVSKNLSKEQIDKVPLIVSKALPILVQT